MGLLRGKLAQRNNKYRRYDNNHHHRGGVNPFLKLGCILIVYLIGATYTISTKPRLRLQLQQKFPTIFKLLGLYNHNNIPVSSSSSSSSSLQQHDNNEHGNENEHNENSEKQHTVILSELLTRSKSARRIPCGLMIGDHDKEDEDNNVLPIKTCIDLDTEHGLSYLNFHAIRQHYPTIARGVFGSGYSNNQKIIPHGTFQLRMGSIEATIPASPELEIFHNSKHQHGSTSSSKKKFDSATDCGLILGKTFWDNHRTEFHEDELYLFTTAKETKEDTTTSSRVMVPYIRIRKSISFNEEENDNGNGNGNEL